MSWSQVRYGRYEVIPRRKVLIRILYGSVVVPEVTDRGVFIVSLVRISLVNVPYYRYDSRINPLVPISKSPNLLLQNEKFLSHFKRVYLRSQVLRNSSQLCNCSLYHLYHGQACMLVYYH